MAYGRSDVTFQGPFPTAFLLNGGQHELSIEYDHGHTALDVRSSDGFDVSRVCLLRAVRVSECMQERREKAWGVGGGAAGKPVYAGL